MSPQETLPPPTLTAAERLKFVRENVLRLTQAQLAERMGVSRANVTNWESGTYRPDLDNAVGLYRVTGIEVEAWSPEVAG